MVDKVVDGIFTIALLAFVLLNADNVKKAILGASSAYGKTIAGLQGREVSYK